MNDREMLLWVLGYMEGSIDEIGLRKDKANVVLDSLRFHMKPNQRPYLNLNLKQPGTEKITWPYGADLG